jgi:hypothetical protein
MNEFVLFVLDVNGFASRSGKKKKREREKDRFNSTFRVKELQVITTAKKNARAHQFWQIKECYHLHFQHRDGRNV